LIFALKLHIGPEEMGRMFFYDISMLYKKYVEYLDEENKQQKEEQERYEEEYNDKYKQPDLDAMMKQANSNTPNMDSITRGFSMPNYGGMNFGNMGNLSNFGV